MRRFGLGWMGALQARWLGRVAPAVLSRPESAAVIASIEITGTASISAYLGTSQLTATATWSDASTTDVSATATWVSASTTKVTVSGTGLAARVFTGTSSVTAAVGAITSPGYTITSAARLPQSAAEMAVATGGFGTWTTIWDFQEAAATGTASPIVGTGDITVGAACTQGVAGLASVASDKAMQTPTYGAGSDCVVPTGPYGASAGEDFAIIKIGVGGVATGGSGGLGCKVADVGGNPSSFGYWGGAIGDNTVTSLGYAHGTTPVVNITVGERDAAGAGADRGTTALATAVASGALALVDVTGRTWGGSSGDVTAFYGAGTTTMIAAARGVGACTGMAVNAAAVCASVVAYTGIS